MGVAITIPLAAAGVEPPHPLPPAVDRRFEVGGRSRAFRRSARATNKEVRMGLETPETKRVVIAEPEPLHIPRPQPAQEPKPEPVKVPA